MDETSNASRRSVLKGSALGAGTLLGAAGLAATARAAGATPPKADSAAPATPGPAGDQYFLKIDGIDGESLQKGFEKWIEITDFGFGARRAAKNGSSAAKEPSEIQMHFDAPVSTASPLLMLSAFDGKAIKSGGVSVTTNQSVTFLKIELTDIVVSSYEVAATDTDRPQDQCSLSFGKIKFSYQAQSPTGGLTPPITTVWDLRSNKI